jgi:hypothetical protein
VTTFLRHAEEIFTTASESPADGDWSLFVSRNGSIRVVAGGEPFDPSARESYRVTRSRGMVRVEARSPGASCVLESSRRAVSPACLPPDFPRYLTA